MVNDDYKKKKLRLEAEAKLRKMSHSKLELNMEKTRTLVHELEVHQIELEMQNQELREVQQRLEEVRDGYSDLFDFAPIGYLILDEKGVIENINLTACKMMGLDRSLIKGKPFSAYMSPKESDTFFLKFREALQSGIFKSFELLIKQSNHGEFNSLIHGSVTENREGKVICRLSMQDVTQIRKAESLQQKHLDLQNKKEKIQRYLDFVPVIILLLDNEYKIQLINQKGCELLGYSKQVLQGKNWFEYVMPIKDRAENSRTPNYLKQKKLLSLPYFEGEVLCESGEPRIIGWTNTKLKDKFGHFIGTLSAGEDITERKKLEITKKKYTENLEETAKAKELFMANMSHELRTPLNIINGVINELIKRKVSKDTSFLLNQANSASMHVLNLVNNVLDFAKINAGEIKLENREFQLSKTFQNTFNIFSLMAKEKGLKYELSIDSEIHDTVLGDYGKLNQILINLLGNAIKFTENGMVKLSISLAKNLKNKQVLEFRIIDTGIGMDSDFQKKVFSGFKQEIHSNKINSGTGLGMPISKRLLNLMGSEIYLDSVKNYGTTVRFILEFEKRKFNSFDAVQLLNNKLLDNKRILIVEDNYMNALLLERKLMNLGAKTFKAENGKIGVDLISKMDMDLVLMDIQMPIMDGLEATLAVREKHGKSLPIIAITANAFKENIDQCLKVGMNDYIIKPFEDNNVISKILTTLRIDKKYELQNKLTEEFRATIRNNDYSLEKLDTISNGDNSFFMEMVEVFCDLSNSSIEQLEEAIEKKDQRSIKNIAHKLRTSLEDIKANNALILAKYLDTSESIDWDESYKTSKELIKILRILSKEIENRYLRS